MLRLPPSYIYLFVLFILSVTGCTASIPSSCNTPGKAPVLYPDYTDSVIPPNIAPLNFCIMEPGDQYKTLIRAQSDIQGKNTIVLSGKTVKIPIRFWKSLLKKNRGKNICFDVYIKRDGSWNRMRSVVNKVSNDPIDSHVVYRLIPPGQYFGEITLNQRNVETFSERPFFDNNATFNNKPTENGTCANCHYFKNHKTDEFLFHVRYVHGGTILYRKGKLHKIDTMFGETGNAATYPTWHPNLPLIVFSANETLQLIHSRSIKKNETFDAYSDLLLYDIEKNLFTHIFKTRTEFETFPCWTPDGNTLYYCECSDIPSDKIDILHKSRRDSFFTIDEFETFKYNLLKMSFDQTTQAFGKPEMVIDVVKDGKSIAFPRISPDGRFLIYTLADFGTFPIMHHESDLWLYDLATEKTRPMSEINSDMPETYHCWDSSGRWLVFSSRRDDGSFTRLYFAHIDEDGVGSKPFLLPQKDPQDNMRRMKSYNIPEMISEPITVPIGRIMRLVESGELQSSEYR